MDHKKRETVFVPVQKRKGNKSTPKRWKKWALNANEWKGNKRLTAAESYGMSYAESAA